MYTHEELHMETQALAREAENLIAVSRQQRTLLECLTGELLKLHTRLKQYGLSSDMLPQMLAARGLLHSFPSLLQAEKLGNRRDRTATRPDQETLSFASILAQVE